jgi:hypothetical protein
MQGLINVLHRAYMVNRGQKMTDIIIMKKYVKKGEGIKELMNN